MLNTVIQKLHVTPLAVYVNSDRISGVNYGCWMHGRTKEPRVLEFTLGHHELEGERKKGGVRRQISDFNHEHTEERSFFYEIVETSLNSSTSGD